MNKTVSILGALALFACNGGPLERNATSNDPSNAEINRTAPEVANTAISDDRTLLEEPKGPIDPKSAEAAGQVVQHYGALTEQARWAEAERLWGNADSAARMTAELRRYPDMHLEIGDLAEMEGAAGSIYITEPVVFYGRDENGAAFRRPATVTLRRVNDVPGSTEEQRRWHIERIEWGDAR